MTQLAALTQSLWRGWMRWIPVRILSAKHRPKIAAHLKSLGTQDRYLRFGYAATDEQIENYVAQLDFVRDDIYGVFNRRLDIVSMAHLAYSVDPAWLTCAEFGVSVDLKMRGRGLGARMFDRAMTHARNEGVSLLFIHALSENTPMLKIARKAGARVERDGSESEAWLRLPPDTVASHVGEAIERHMAELDFQFKRHVRVLGDIIEIGRAHV